MAVSSPPSAATTAPVDPSSLESHPPSGTGGADHALPHRIAERYLVHEELGRGGLAVVYSVTDQVTGQKLALKQLALPAEHPSFAEQAAAFEREYHTLVQLTHPRIIEAYDFGVGERGRYYTMELLDGGDLRKRCPLPWRQACDLMYDVCSSLALLHSRHLVHRDVSPRNVRSTLSGAAKLIDFGALCPMGPSAQVVGTPPFVAPEVVHRSTLDGRTDLFSLGASLYFALTGQLAYPARHLSSLSTVWRVRPAAPSALVPDIPPPLDALVLSLISLDPAARPRSAFEVMKRLSAIAGLERVEDEEVSQAYLIAPVLVGRDDELAAIRDHLSRALSGRGNGVLLEADAGLGRSRLLDACALEAKIRGALVLRANAAGDGDGLLGVARALCQQAIEATPELAVASAEQEQAASLLFQTPAAAPTDRDGSQLRLAPPPGSERERSAYQSAVARWLTRIAHSQPLAILVDDVHSADQASLALLGSMTLSAPELRLFVLATAERDAPLEDAETFAVLRRECRRVELAALERVHTDDLVVSLFGDVPHAALVADRLHEAAQGNPRETMEMVQSLIARGLLRYRDGSWQLPEQLDPAELPTSAAEACRRGARALSALARSIGQLHALASRPALGRRDIAAAMPDVPSEQLDAAITELLTQRVLTGENHAYALSRREWSRALLEGLEPAAIRDRHRRLAEMYARAPGSALESTHHLLAADQEALGIDQLTAMLSRLDGDSLGLMASSEMKPYQIAQVLDRGLTSAQRLGRSPSELHQLRRGLVAISIVTDEAHYLRAAPAWFAQLEQDSGLALYRSLSELDDRSERLRRALTLATERYQATDPAERVLNPGDAIKSLAHYVAISMAIAARMQDAALIASLPDVLEPFAGTSPVLHAIWQNSIATREAMCDNQPERARERWQRGLDVLSQVSSTELSYVAAVRGALLYGIASMEARMSIESAEQTVRMLEDDPMQAVSAMSLRKVARLHKGDFGGAERFRRQAEQLALRSNVRSMFSSTLQTELVAYALAGDLTGISQVARGIAPLAERFPGWRGYEHLAAGYFEQTREHYDAALAAFERGLAVSSPAPRETGLSCGAWPRLLAGAIEALVSLGRAQEARERGERAVAECEEHGIGALSLLIRRALALAEAKLGDYAGASRRLEGVIAGLAQLGVTGLELGATYEARARVAVWFADGDDFETFARHTTREYRYGEGSSLGARYERLVNEARQAGLSALPQLAERAEPEALASQWDSSTSALQHRLAIAGSPEERSALALRLLCEAQASDSGHLYLQTAQGLCRVASHGDVAPSGELDSVAQSACDLYLGDSEVLATQTMRGESELYRSSPSFIDADGRRYVPLLLMCDVDGRQVCAGTAMIAEGSATMFAVHHLRSAIAESLLQAGDACPRFATGAVP